jgi:hypothetical protein
MKPGKLIERLPAKPLDRLLFALQEVRRRRDSGEDVALPLLTFQMRSGRDVKGWLINVGRDEDQGALLVQLEDADKRPSDDVAYLDLSSVSAIVVHQAERSADLISFGQIEGPVGPAPSKLDLKRKLTAAGQPLSDRIKHPIVFDADWNTVPDSETALRRIAAAITDLSVVATGIAESSVGAEALQSVQKIVLAMGDQPSKRDGGVVSLALAPESRPATTRETLKNDLEAQL